LQNIPHTIGSGLAHVRKLSLALSFWPTLRAAMLYPLSWPSRVR
jgi:hypothetical protein